MPKFFAHVTKKRAQTEQAEQLAGRLENKQESEESCTSEEMECSQESEESTLEEMDTEPMVSECMDQVHRRGFLMC